MQNLPKLFHEYYIYILYIQKIYIKAKFRLVYKYNSF